MDRSQWPPIRLWPLRPALVQGEGDLDTPITYLGA